MLFTIYNETSNQMAKVKMEITITEVTVKYTLDGGRTFAHSCYSGIGRIIYEKYR